jgi:hypothetical protein
MSSSRTPPASEPSPGERVARRTARTWIPGTLLVVGIVVAVLISVEVGAVILAAAVIAVVADLWIRLGMRSQDDRDDEARARRIFRRRGRWPED